MSRVRLPFVAIGLILLFMICLLNPVSANGVPTLSADPSTVHVTAGGSGSTTITFHLSYTIGNPIMSCVGLPAGASCSFPPLLGIFHDGDHFTLTISASSSTAPGTYSVMVQLASFSSMILPGFLAISPIEFNPAGGGGIGPSSISIQQAPPFVAITLVVDPAVIPEYPLGLPGLAIFMIIGYGLIRRRTSTRQL